MRSKEIVLLSIAVVAVGIFALPSAVSMFGGQHNWYDLTLSGNDVPCEKCHSDVADELSNSGPHVNMECWYCHRTGNLTGYTYASGDGTASIPGEEAHAASTVECMECHEGFGLGGDEKCTICHDRLGDHPAEWMSDKSLCEDCHKGDLIVYHPVQPAKLEAGGFNLTINPDDTGSAAAHKAFVHDSINETLMEGANEACIACHTHVATDILWEHAYKMNFTADGTGGKWNVYDFTSEGNYTVLTYGNMTGNTTGVSNVTVTISPTPPGYDETNP